MEARRVWADVMETLRNHQCKTRLLYPMKFSVTIDGKNTIFHDNTKVKQYLYTNADLQKIEGKLQPNEVSQDIDNVTTAKEHKHTITLSYHQYHNKRN